MRNPLRNILHLSHRWLIDNIIVPEAEAFKLSPGTVQQFAQHLPNFLHYLDCAKGRWEQDTLRPSSKQNMPEYIVHLQQEKVSQSHVIFFKGKKMLSCFKGISNRHGLIKSPSTSGLANIWQL